MDCARHNLPLLPVAYCGGQWYHTLCQGCVDAYESQAMSLKGKTYRYVGQVIETRNGKYLEQEEV